MLRLTSKGAAVETTVSLVTSCSMFLPTAVCDDSGRSGSSPNVPLNLCLLQRSENGMYNNCQREMPKCLLVEGVTGRERPVPSAAFTLKQPLV